MYDDIAKILEEDPDYDYGSYGPVFIRLAWHASGTYDKATGTGGSNKGTMRYEPESKHDANAGLHVARAKLEKIKSKYPWISYGDLWTLAGVVAIQEMVKTCLLIMGALIQVSMPNLLIRCLSRSAKRCTDSTAGAVT